MMMEKSAFGSAFGFAGWSGSGKTTLIIALIDIMTKRGLIVSTIKHAHHQFDVDQKGKDSYRHRQAGAQEVFVISDKRWAHMHELRIEQKPRLAAIIKKMAAADVILVEGFKHAALPKLEVFRHANNKPLLYPEDNHIIALASDKPAR